MILEILNYACFKYQKISHLKEKVFCAFLDTYFHSIQKCITNSFTGKFSEKFIIFSKSFGIFCKLLAIVYLFEPLADL